MDLQALADITDVEALRAIITAQAQQLSDAEAAVAREKAETNKRDSIIDLLRAQLTLLRHGKYGASSEKANQLELMLEDLEANRAEALAAIPVSRTETTVKDKPSRQPLPDHLPREERVYDAPCTCPDCGGSNFLKAPDSVHEVLDYVPASFKVVRHIEKRFICKGCDKALSGEMPSLPIQRGKPGAGLLAHVLVSKFDDHLPLYRQSEIYAREGVEISRSTLADWVGQASHLLTPLVDLIKAHVFTGCRLHSDDTPVPVLEPGKGRTKTGRLWVYVRDGRDYQEQTPPAVAYFFSPDRKGEHPKDHLAGFNGVLHADGYAGYKKLYGNSITEAACWAHLRRKFHDVIKIKPSSLASEALQRIGELYDIEARIKGMPPDERRRKRQEHARPRVEALHRWIKETLPKVPQKQTLAEAMRYGLSRWEALRVYLDDGTVEIDNNAAERAIRPIAVGRNNWLFAGSDAGGERTANILTLIETAKLNGLEPERYLADAIGRISGLAAGQQHDLLPWRQSQGRKNV